MGCGLLEVVPFPFDHFFFCFLPPLVAAGAWREAVVSMVISLVRQMEAGRSGIAYHVDGFVDLVRQLPRRRAGYGG